MKLEAISFKNNTLSVIDQTLLPQCLKLITLESLNKSIEAIKSLRVRGAPAIGIVAAYAIYLESQRLAEDNLLDKNAFIKICERLAASRPTAVNLYWAINRMKDVYLSNIHLKTIDLILQLKNTAIFIHEDDKNKCSLIGSFGAKLFKNYINVLTHCNAGILATGGNGTALSVIYETAKANKDLHVYVDETRPLGQGARLTYYELMENHVKCTLLTDNAAGSLFSQNKIDAVIVGADRIALNGDFANKIGTFTLAVLSKQFNIPFYVAAPSTTFDINSGSGKEIPIEMRKADEVLSFWGIEDSKQHSVYNPAFDITENDFVSAFITELGVINQPYKKTINNILQS